jgi:hypothetical protein
MPVGFSGGGGNGLQIISGTTNGGVSRNSFTCMGRFFFSTDPNVEQRLFSMLDSSTSYLLLQTGSAGDNLRLSINGTTSTAHTIVCDSRWYDVAIKVAGEGTDQAEFLIGEATAASLTKYTFTRTGSWVADDMAFGGSVVGDINPNGAMENWLIYDRVLTDAEVEIQRRMRRPIITNGLWGWWPMMGGTIAEHLRDLSGGGRNLTQVGSNAVIDASWMPWGGSIIVPHASAAASNAPVLSLAGVQDITATSARPKVTLAFA